jgi:hypothetical protein
VNEKIESLQNQVNSLQDRIRDLETTRDNSKYALSRTRMYEKTPFTSQQGNTGFQLQAEGKISGTRDYESTQDSRLIPTKGSSLFI